MPTKKTITVLEYSADEFNQVIAKMLQKPDALVKYQIKGKPSKVSSVSIEFESSVEVPE